MTQEETFSPDVKSSPNDHAWLLANWYEEDYWSDGEETIGVLEDHKMAITWAYMWYWGFIKLDNSDVSVEPAKVGVDAMIPEGLHAGLFNAYAYVLDLYGKDPYNDIITDPIDLED